MKQEKKHLIIIKQYHEVDFESDFVQGKEDYKRDSEEE